MKKEVYLTILFDYYETLLNDKDICYFKDYYFGNLSLSEIAEVYNLSRNAVHKRLKKIEKDLLNYEDKLKLYDKEQAILSLIDDELLRNKIKKILN